MKKVYLKQVVGALLLFGITTSCVRKDDWSVPDITCTNKFGDATTTMAAFAALAPSNGSALNITDDQIFDGYVISSDEQGSFYKTIVFQDKPENPTVGLQIEIEKTNSYADFPVGTHIRINAKGLILRVDKGVTKLGVTDAQYAVGKIPSSSVGNHLSIVCNNGRADIANLVPLALANLDEAKQAQHINKLVTVPNVQFADSEILVPNGPKTYVDVSSNADTNRELVDTSGKTAILRTSKFADFGKDKLPTGKGSITFVVSKYNTTYQMLIRSTSDVNFTQERVDTAPAKGGTTIVYAGAGTTENFESYNTGASSEAFAKYINDPVLGNRYWRVSSHSGNKYLSLGFGATGAKPESRTMFIVPVNFSNMTKFSFDSKDGHYNGNVLKIYYSTDYQPSVNILNATLTDITSAFTISSNNTNYPANFTNSGHWIKPSTLTGNGFIIFEYHGGGTLPTTTIQIDNIKVE